MGHGIFNFNAFGILNIASHNVAGNIDYKIDVNGLFYAVFPVVEDSALTFVEFFEFIADI